MSNEYIEAVNVLVQSMVDAGKSITYSSKDFTANLPSAVKAQCTLDAKSIYRKHKKRITKILAVLKKPVCVWNNQNYCIEEGSINFPVWVGLTMVKSSFEGIRVEYVNPAYTSQICPSCGKHNKAKDRNYKCSCGYKNHRDLVGAKNIINAPVADGNSLSA